MRGTIASDVHCFGRTSTLFGGYCRTDCVQYFGKTYTFYDLRLPASDEEQRRGAPIKAKPVNNIADLSHLMWRLIAPRPQDPRLIPPTSTAKAKRAR